MNINWNKLGNIMLSGAVPGVCVGTGAAFFLPIITTYLLILTAAGIAIPASFFLGFLFAKPQTALPPAPESDWESNAGQLSSDIAKMDEG